MFFETLGLCSLIIFCYMSLVFLLSLVLKNNSIVDSAWGPGFIIIILVSMWYNNAYQPRNIVILILVLLWGVRITAHITARNWGKPEDPRYAKWRKEWGNNVVLRSFLQVFMLQGFVLLIIAYPLMLINSVVQNTSLNYLDFLGLGIWVIGYIFEVVGDYQLKCFLSDSANKGKIMKSGLWRYTRHPNYFGEAVMWWGIWLIALSVPYGFTTIISPLLITYLLLYVSGVPMAEMFFENNVEFQQYKKETSAFFPWFINQI